MAYIDLPGDVVHIYGLTLGKMLDLCVENPIRVHRTLFHGTEGPGLDFHEHMYSTNQNKGKSPSVKPRTEKAIGVDLRVPPSRVSRGTDHRSVGITGKLACLPNLCVQV